MDSHVSWAQNAANSLYAQLGTWESVAAELAPFLDLSGASWWYVAQGERVTRERVNALRLHAGLCSLPALRIVEACPSCSIVHGEGLDCHGAEIADVVALAPGQRVAAVRKPPQPRTLSDYPVAVLARMIAHREPYTPQP